MSMKNHQTALPLLSSTGRSVTSRTTTGRPRSNISSSASIHRLNLSSACSNYIFPSHLPMKKLKPEPWQRLFDGEKRHVYSQQGLTVRKNKQLIDAIINEEFFNLPDDQNKTDDDSQHSSLPAPVQAHIDNLCAQIDELVLQLSEERLNHRQTRTKGEEILTTQLQNQNKQFQELLHRKMLDHEKELEEQSEKYSKSLLEEKVQYDKREQVLKDEIEFLKTSFHTYKINLEKESEDKLQAKTNEALENIRKQLREKEEEINTKINEAVVKERKSFSTKHKMEIENMRKQHQKEIETIHKTFADSAFDRTKIETLTKELTSTQLELDDTKERATKLFTQIKDLEIRYIEATRQLNDFRANFDEKTKEIEKLYAGKLDELRLQNSDLRNMYLKKCDELVQERSLTKQKLNEQVNFTRKQLRKKLLNVRITSAVQLNPDDQPCRLSTYATASQYESSPSRCNSAFASSHPISTMNNNQMINDNRITDFTIENTRRETKLHRRNSVPVTETEHDIIRYLASKSIIVGLDLSTSSKYNFESQPSMLKNLSLEDLQETFKSQ